MTPRTRTRRSLRAHLARPKRARTTPFDPWQRAALAVHEMHLGQVWTSARLMERFKVSRAQAKRDMTRLEALPGVFAAHLPGIGRGGYTRSVSISRHVTRGTLVPIAASTVIAAHLARAAA